MSTVYLLIGGTFFFEMPEFFTFAAKIQFMELTLTTPALLFSAISLLLLAYTNRFLAIAALVRGLRDKYLENPSGLLIGQIKNLRSRLSLIRNMQILGLSSLDRKSVV